MRISGIFNLPGIIAYMFYLLFKIACIFTKFDIKILEEVLYIGSSLICTNVFETIPTSFINNYNNNENWYIFWNEKGLSIGVIKFMTWFFAALVIFIMLGLLWQIENEDIRYFDEKYKSGKCDHKPKTVKSPKIKRKNMILSLVSNDKSLP